MDCPILVYTSPPFNDYNDAKAQCGKKDNAIFFFSKKKNQTLQKCIDTSCPDGRCSIEMICSVRESDGYHCGLIFHFSFSFSKQKI